MRQQLVQSQFWYSCTPENPQPTKPVQCGLKSLHVVEKYYDLPRHAIFCDKISDNLQCSLRIYPRVSPAGAYRGIEPYHFSLFSSGLTNTNILRGQ